MTSIDQTTGRQETAGRLSAFCDPDVDQLLAPAAAGQGRVMRTVLPSGLRVITEYVPGVRSACVGVWAHVGSADETPALHGASHFLEHLLFKGTDQRSAWEISTSLDRVGGQFNAFTTKEYTCFHARVLDRDLRLAVDVLGEMVTAPTLAAADVEAEREVILDEIAMYADDPDDVAQDLLCSQAWGETDLGRSVAGTAASVAALSADQIAAFHARHYRPGELVVAVAGNVDHAEVVALVRDAFAHRGFLDAVGSPRPVADFVPARPIGPGQVAAVRDHEQCSVILGYAGLARRDPDRYALSVLTNVLGGTSSSRLFQEVRERRGLAYAVGSFAMQHQGAGLVGVEAAALPRRVDAVLETVRGELDRLIADGITTDELETAVGQLNTAMVLGMEDTFARMARLAKAEMFHDELPSVDLLMERVQAVDRDAVVDLAARLFGAPEVLVRVGPRG